MNIKIKHIYILILFFLVLSFKSYSQFFYSNLSSSDFKLEFLKEHIEAKANTSFFNVINIKNKSENKVHIQLNLSIPQNWQLFCDKKQLLTINPKDSLQIPIRVAVSKDVKGDIGYSIIASVSDKKGNLLKNAYSFIKIPSESDLRIQAISRVEYFDQKTGKAPFSIKFINKGNKDELISLLFTTDRTLSMPNSAGEIYSTDISLPPHTDTTTTFEAILDKSADNRDILMHKINIRASTIDTALNYTVWFKNLQYDFKNKINEENKALVVELFAQNIFSEYEPIYSTNIFGTLLLKKNRNVYYYYRNQGSKTKEQLFKKNRMYLGYSDLHFNIRIGDITSNIEQSMYGRGFEASYKLKKHKIKLIHTKNIFSPVYNSGLKYDFSVNKSLGLNTGFAYKKQNYNKIESKLGFIGTNFTLPNNHRIGTMFAFSDAFHQYSKSYNKQGYGFGLNYSGLIKKISINVNSKYGTRFYSGVYKGRLDLRGTAKYSINDKNLINLQYNNYRNNPSLYILDSLLPEKYTNYQEYRLQYGFFMNPKTFFYSEPTFKIQSSNRFIPFRDADYFSTNKIGFRLGIRIRGENSYNSISPSINFGFTDVTNFSSNFYGINNPEIKNISTIVSQEYKINFRRKFWGFLLMYYYGPRTLNEEFTYFYSRQFPKTLRIMPYFDKFIYKRIVKLTTRAGYANDIVTNTTRLNLNTQILCHLQNDWTLRLLNTYSIQNRTDKETGTSFNYSTTYYEFSVKKEFNFNQPRVKYYDFNMVLYKDFNGNRRRDENEPGVKNVLVEIRRDEQQIGDQNVNVDFTAVDLLSDNFGRISYQNLPIGNYTIVCRPMGKNQGNFNLDKNTYKYTVEKDMNIYLPFLESNKIFGKIVLNRSKLSNLGDIDVSNIRITATDSHGIVYSSLTDKKGNFVTFVPNVDRYNVKISNIFYEHFELQQNNFIVQLNGYKQFELSFVFNEKSRKIHFNTTFDFNQTLDMPGVKIVRRTSLKGTIKDATTLVPVKARIKIVDRTNNNVVISTVSSGKTGDYFVSFVAGDNYDLIVNADDYWFHTENLFTNQLTTFQNITRDILLQNIAVDSKIGLKNLNFEAGKADLKPESFAELDRLLDLLKDNPTIRLEVDGFSDDLETLDNPDISNERAKVVVQYLIEQGFSNVAYKGFKNSKPIATNDTEDGRRQNRRVEVVVTSK
ncbi:MAG: OmpA family protein [Bacteroidetes bacterium]|nr:OmpA family protein [Bacteroidota bacterium]